MDLIIGIGPSTKNELHRAMTFRNDPDSFDEAERAEQWNSEAVYKHPSYVRLDDQIYSSKRDSRGVSPHNSPLDWERYYVQDVDGVIYSYEHVLQSASLYQRLWKRGLRTVYRIPRNVKLFLDNGSFGFSSKGYTGSLGAYEVWADKMEPDWKPMPRDFIPWVEMSDDQLTENMNKTIENNIKYSDQGYAMIFHAGPRFEDYLTQFQQQPKLQSPEYIALGSIHGKIQTLNELIYYVKRSKEVFPNSHLHLFGVGSMRTTVHVPALFGVDSIDSAGWYVSASKFGRIMSPTALNQTISIAEHLNERQGKPTTEQLDELSKCPCPSCERYPLEVFQDDGVIASTARAAHNLYHLMDEKEQVRYHVKNNTYDEWQKERNPKFYDAIQLALEKYETRQLSLLPQGHNIKYYDSNNGTEDSIFRQVEFSIESFEATQLPLFDLSELKLPGRKQSKPRAKREPESVSPDWIASLYIDDIEVESVGISANSLIKAKDKAREISRSNIEFNETLTSKPKWEEKDDYYIRTYDRSQIKLTERINDEI